MKRFSITTRVTIWYVCSMLLLMILLFACVIYAGNRMVQQDVCDDLTSIVENAKSDITVKNGQLNVNNHLDTYQNQVYLLIYLENHFIVTGTLPDGLTEEIPFVAEKVRQITNESGSYYVYDELIDERDFGDVWVRGITSAKLADSDPAILSLLKLFFVFLPLFVLLAAIGGYFLTRRAFLPVSQIRETAEQITASSDLSRRIGLDVRENNTKDELYQLSGTFDKMLDRMESAFEKEKQFSDDASHELRTPISVIMAQSEYALSRDDTPEEAREALAVILKQSQKMSGLINKLLMLARADRGAIAIDPERLNVSELAEMAAIEQEYAAAEKGIRIQMDIQPDIFAEVDESLFIRLWINLISNSIKYGRKGGIVKVVLSQSENRLLGEVIDNGIGMDEALLPKIWDRFYQVNPSRGEESGAGLGLPIVKWIVSAHNGTITAESAPGEGSRFAFSLPLHQAGSNAEQDRAEKARKEADKYENTGNEI